MSTYDGAVSNRQALVSISRYTPLVPNAFQSAAVARVVAPHTDESSPVPGCGLGNGVGAGLGGAGVGKGVGDAARTLHSDFPRFGQAFLKWQVETTPPLQSHALQPSNHTKQGRCGTPGQLVTGRSSQVISIDDVTSRLGRASAADFDRVSALASMPGRHRSPSKASTS